MSSSPIPVRDREFITPEFRSVTLDDPVAAPMLQELFTEYTTRYADRPEINNPDRWPAFQNEGHQDFLPPQGDLILLLRDGVPTAGGAFRRRTEPEVGDPARRAVMARTFHDIDGAPLVPTAELKRIWTDAQHRRQGLGRAVVAELERRARDRGYVRLYLTTGPRQPEAVALYRAAGYRPLFDPDRPFDPVRPEPRAFEKWLVDPTECPVPRHRRPQQPMSRRAHP